MVDAKDTIFYVISNEGFSESFKNVDKISRWTFNFSSQFIVENFKLLNYFLMAKALTQT